MTNFRIGPHRTTSNHVWPCPQTRDRLLKAALLLVDSDHVGY